jgi:hypothetical protein
MDPYNLTEYRVAWFEQICEDAPHVLNSPVTDLLPKASRIFAVYESRYNGKLPLCWARAVDRVVTGTGGIVEAIGMSDDGQVLTHESFPTPKRQDGREVIDFSPVPEWHYRPGASQTTEHLTRVVYVAECTGSAAELGARLLKKELNDQEITTLYRGQAFWTDFELAFLIARWALQIGFLREPRPFVQNLDEILSSLDREPYSRWFDADGQPYDRERCSAWITALNAYIEELLEKDCVDHYRTCAKRAVPKASTAGIASATSWYRERLRQSKLILYPAYSERLDFLCGFLIPVGATTLARYHKDRAAREASNQWYYPDGLNAYENEQWLALSKCFEPTRGSLGLTEGVTRHFDVSPEPWNPLSGESRADASKRIKDAMHKYLDEHTMA